VSAVTSSLIGRVVEGEKQEREGERKQRLARQFTVYWSDLVRTFEEGRRATKDAKKKKEKGERSLARMPIRRRPRFSAL